MTIIKKVTAKGFKSFAKQTELLFGNKFNVILGPNGSGKSNIVDSLCFVLGKLSAKGLRAERSANLIYNGGKKGTPAKEAEVSIVFDNSQKVFPLNTDEMVITRVVKKSGNSIYKINNEPRTRQQVLDTLRAANIEPDGHNIILQGDIVRFMEMKPEERRELIEEVAGISVWEDKKQKSLNELARVEESLKMASVMFVEKERYLKELKKDRDQALKYKELEKNVKDNKATYFYMQIKSKEEKKQEVESRINKQNQELEKIKERVNGIKQKIEEKKQEIQKINQEMEEKGEEEQRKISKDLVDLRADIIRNEERIETCRNEIQKISSRVQNLQKELQEHDKSIDELDLEKEQINKKITELVNQEQEIQKEINKFKSKHGIKDTFSTKIDDVEKEMEQKQEDIVKYQEDKQQLLNKKNQTELQLKQVEEKLNEILDLNKENQEKISRLETCRKDFKQIVTELSSRENKHSEFKTKIFNFRQRLVQVSENLAKLNTRQINLREFTRGDEAIRSVLELKKGICGTISDLGQTNSKHSLALEIAAGSRINSVVVEDDSVASNCIKYLKEKRLGVVTFLPLNKMRKRQARKEVKDLTVKKGVIGLAVELVNFDSKFKDVFSYVFGDTLIVEDVATARRIGIGNARMVTLEGDLMEQSGAMSGGYRTKRAGKFREKDLNENITKLTNEENKFKKELEELEQQKLDNENDIWKLKEKKALLEGELTNLEDSIGFKGDLEEFKKNKEKFEGGIKDLIEQVKQKECVISYTNDQIQKLKEQRNELRTKLRQPEIAEGLSQLEEKKQKTNLELIESKAELKRLEDKIVSLHQAEKEKIRNILKEHEKEQEKFQEEIKNRLQELKNKKGDLRQKESTEKKFYNEFKSLFAKRTKINEWIRTQENEIVRHEDKIKYAGDRLNSLNIEKARITAEMDGLQEEAKEFADGKIRRGITIEELMGEIRQFDRMMKDMGNVNLRALEIYEDVYKKYQEIVERKEKLKQEKEDVFNLMKEIDNRKQFNFMKTFKILQENFKTAFSKLTTKGEAYLELENKQNVFEGGVDIRVKIVGNRHLDIKSLSGGEKTLAALAFIFSIQEFQPASFYLLDEVDAALDKRNSELLSKLIQKYSDKAQYIVISHNDQLITEADQIYGISMQDGVSKVVSLKI